MAKAKKKATVAKAKKAPKKPAKTREVLVVASKVKEYIKSLELQSSGDVIEQVSNKVYEMLEAAGARAKENGRKTVRPYDL